MKTYIRFLISIFFKSFIYVLLVLLSLVFILNLLTELEFFKDINVDLYFTLLLSFLNSPSMIFEMFPFIFLITTQLFFIKLFQNREIEVFKYSGLKNSSIILVVSIISFVTGLAIITFYYNLSSNLKNFYLGLKSSYTDDGKYLAVITQNGLWIKDEINEKIIMINSSEIKPNKLINNFITVFDENYISEKTITSKEIDISKNEWIIYDAKIFESNSYLNHKEIKLETNFDYNRIQSLYSNLSSLNIFMLYELRENYKRLNYSLTEIDLQILKLVSYPIYLLLMTIFASLIMLNIKRFDSTALKIAIGLFFSVVIYYISNFFFIMGSTERMPLIISIFIPLILLSFTNILMFRNINDK